VGCGGGGKGGTTNGYSMNFFISNFMTATQYSPPPTHPQNNTKQPTAGETYDLKST